MTREDWKKVDELLQAALGRAPLERTAFLNEACAGDDALRREVESLIEYDSRAGNFLEIPAFEASATLIVEAESGFFAGRDLGHYKLQRKIGSGGMGEVYLAQDTILERTVALKILAAELADDTERLRRFTQEAKSASALNHPNIITVHEISCVASTHFIVTEYVDGITLREKIRKAEMPVSEVLDVARQIGGALASAHDAGIVHRDIKPENIMIRRDGYVKVVDFGLAKLTERHRLVMDAETSLQTLLRTDPGVVMGTVHYMSPEQARGLEVDTKTDIWSFGVVLYEMITGRVPFAGETQAHVIVSILEHEPAPATRLTSEIPAQLQCIISKALSKDRENRYQSARDLIVDLEEMQRYLGFQGDIKKLANEGASVASSGDANLLPQAIRGSTEPTNQRVKRDTDRGLWPGLRTVLAANGRKVAFVALFLTVGAVALFIFLQGQRPGVVGSRSKLSYDYDSVAVLPMASAVDNQGNDSYLADGFSESLITRLAQLPNLRVVPWVTSQQYRLSKKSLQVMATEMKVKSLITGTVRKAESKIEVSIALIDAASGTQLWGDEFEEQSADIFLVQKRVAVEAATKLRGKLTGQQEELLARPPSQSAEAYELYLRGKGALRQQTRAGNELAFELFQRALKLDPNMAEPYSGTGRVLFNRYYFGWGQNVTYYLEQAEKNYQTAISLNPEVATSYSGLAEVYMVRSRYEEILNLGGQLSRLKPDDPEALVARAEIYRAGCLPEKSIPLLLRAIELDPANESAATLLVAAYGESKQLAKSLEAIHSYQRKFGATTPSHFWSGILYQELEDFEQAQINYESAIKQRPDDHRAYLLLGILYKQFGKVQKARQAWQMGLQLTRQALNASPEKRVLRGRLLRYYSYLGDRQAARREQNKLLKEDLDGGMYYNLGISYAALGETDKAVLFLKKALHAGELCATSISKKDGLERLEQSNGYQEFLKERSAIIDRLREHY